MITVAILINGEVEKSDERAMNEHIDVWYDIEYNKFRLVEAKDYLLHDMVIGDEFMVWIGVL